MPSGKKPLHEPVLTRSPTPYGVARPQWVNSFFPFILLFYILISFRAKQAYNINCSWKFGLYFRFRPSSFSTTEGNAHVGMLINTLRPRQNCRHFANVFNCFSQMKMYEFPALVQIMAWRQAIIIWCNDGAYMHHSASMSETACPQQTNVLCLLSDQHNCTFSDDLFKERSHIYGTDIWRIMKIRHTSTGIFIRRCVWV